MSALLVHCPVTGQTIDTGIDTNKESLFGLDTEQLSVKCPYCQTSHRIAVRDGELGRGLATRASSAGP